MAGNLREIRELETEIETAGKWQLGKQQILDLLRSQAKVGGAMSVTDGAAPYQQFTIAGGWNRIDVWERSIDTQGVADGLADPDDPGGWYRVSNAAAGDYTVTAAIRATVSLPGDYEIRIAKVNDADPAETSTTPYRDKVTATLPGETISLQIAAGIIKGMGERDGGIAERRLQLEMRGPNGATVTVLYGQFGVWR